MLLLADPHTAYLETLANIQVLFFSNTLVHICALAFVLTETKGVGGGGLIFVASVQNLEEKEKRRRITGGRAVWVCVCVTMCNKKSCPLVNGAIHHSLLGIGLGV